MLLHLPRQRLTIYDQPPPQVAGEGVELFQLGVCERQDLRKECVEANVIRQPTA